MVNKATFLGFRRGDCPSRSPLDPPLSPATLVVTISQEYEDHALTRFHKRRGEKLRKIKLLIGLHA